MATILEEIMKGLKTGQDPLSIAEEAEIPKVNRSLNYAQLFDMLPQEAYDYHDTLKYELERAMKQPDLIPKLSKFDPEAGPEVDAFTGATAKDYAGIFAPILSRAMAMGYNTSHGAVMASASLFHNLDLVARYIERKTGMERGKLFQIGAERGTEAGKRLAERVKEEGGLGPVDAFFTELAGAVIPGITDFILDLPIIFPFHGMRAAEEAAQRGDSEFVGFLKGAAERNLMGQIFHAASVLPRGARIPIIGGLFEEQARSAGETDPTNLLKAFFTGGIFGTMGGKGKIGMRDVVREFHNLEKEFPVTFEGAREGLGRDLIGGERGAIELKGADRWRSPTADIVGSKGEAIMPANEWAKRITAWGDKSPHVRDENKWNGIDTWLESRGTEKVKRGEVLDFLEMSKGKWAEWEQVAGKTLPMDYSVRKDFESGEWYVENDQGDVLGDISFKTREEAVEYSGKVETTDQWASHNIPGGIPGTAKVWTLSLPTEDPLSPYRVERDTLRQQWNEDRLTTVEYQAKIDELDLRTAFVVRDHYAAPHFPGKPNVVLHVRTEERLDAEGKKGVVMETAQSDWHQKRPDIPKEIAALYQKERGKLTPEEDRILEDFELKQGGYKIGSRVPPAPFESTWPEVAIKHLLDLAAKDPTIGWVGWPSGKVQNERWGKGRGGEIEEMELPPKAKERLDAAFEDFYAGRITEEEVNALSRELAEEEYSKGTFLETLYDKRMPKFAKKYAEKMGGIYKTETLKAETDSFEDGVSAGMMGKELPEKDYSIHRIDILPRMRTRINTEGQTFYTGIDITQLPRLLKDIKGGVEEALPHLVRAGGHLFRIGKKAKEEWTEAMKTALGPEREKYKSTAEDIWVALAASQAEREKRGFTPALRVDGETFEAYLEEGVHGQIWDRIPTDKLEGAKNIETGWVDKDGRWVEKVPKEPLALGEDLTLSQVANLIRVLTGDKIDPGELARTDPVLSKLYEATKKALAPSRIANIKAMIRRVTGQVKVQDILEVKELDALNDQIRYAARQAKIAFGEGKGAGEVRGWFEGRKFGDRIGHREGKAEGKEETAERFQQSIERAKVRTMQRAAIRKMIKELKTVDPSTMTDYTRGEVTTLLDDMDLTKLSSKKRLSLERTREYLERSPDTELPDYVMDDLARLDKMAVRDLTFDQLDSLHKAVMSLAAQSRRAQKIWDGVQDRHNREVVAQSVGEMRPPEQILGDIISTKPTMWDKVSSVTDWVRKSLGIRQDSFDLIVETLAGPNSTMHRVLYRGVKDGDPTGLIPGRGKIGEKRYIQNSQAAFRKDLEETGFFDMPEIRYGIRKIPDVDRWLNERVKIEIDGRIWELSRGERMSLYRHSLNGDNRRALVESGIGFKHAPPSSGIKPNTIIPLREADIEGIVASLSQAERAFAGKPIDNLFSRQGVELDNTFYDLNLYRMELQENYYPKDVMPLSRGGLDLETEEGMEAFREFTARVGIDKGMLISRVGSTRPIYLNDLMSDITRSVTRSAAYIHLEGPMRNASKLLYDTDFKSNLVDRYGRDAWVEIEKGLKDIATNYRLWTETEKGLMKLKTNAVSSILALNPWIWMNQPASIVFYNIYVESNYLAKGLMDVATPEGLRNTLDTIRAYSPELVDRMEGGYDRDVAAAFQQGRQKEFYSGKGTLKEKLLAPTKWSDLTAVIPGMRAAYLKAMDEFQTGKLSKHVKDALDIQDPSVVERWTPAEMEANAWKFADWVTERTQAQSTMEHRSPLSRGTPLEQVFTAMTSQTTAMLGVLRRTTREYKRTGDPEAKSAMMKAYVQVFIVNATLMLGIDRLRDELYGRESKSIVHGFIDNAASTVIFLRDIVTATSSHVFEGERGFDVKYPVQKFSEHMTKAAADLNTIVTTKNEKTRQEAWGSFVDNMIGTVALLSGYPYQTPKRILEGVVGDNPPPKKKRPDFEDELLDW